MNCTVGPMGGLRAGPHGLICPDGCSVLKFMTVTFRLLDRSPIGKVIAAGLVSQGV